MEERGLTRVDVFESKPNGPEHWRVGDGHDGCSRPPGTIAEAPDERHDPPRDGVGILSGRIRMLQPVADPLFGADQFAEERRTDHVLGADAWCLPGDCLSPLRDIDAMASEVEVGVSESEAHRGLREFGGTGHAAITGCERGCRVEGPCSLAAKQALDLNAPFCKPATSGLGLGNPEIGETHIAAVVGDLAVPK